MEEYYGEGGFDPIKNEAGIQYTPLSVTYYDEDGNILGAGSMSD